MPPSSFAGAVLDYLKLFGTATARGRLFWPAMLMILEESVGIEVSDNYCVQFFEEAGVPSRWIIASATTAMVFFKALVLMVSGYMIDHHGRKPPLVFSLAGQTASLVAMGVYFSHGSWQMVIVTWFCYNLFYGAGLGNVCVVVMAEGFPDPKMRAVAVSFCYILNRLVAAVVTGIYPWQHLAMGTPNVFYLWAGVAGIAMLATIFLMEERKGTILECTHG